MGGKEFHCHNLLFKHWNVKNPAEKICLLQKFIS
jgi:hypothetical protein